MVLTTLVGKERLLKQKYRIRRILYLTNRIEQIKGLMAAPSSLKYSDVPKSQIHFDKVGQLIQEKIEKEKELNKILPLFDSESIKINNAINKLRELPQPTRGPLLSSYCDLLRYYYLEDKSWDEIMVAFEFDKEDCSKLRLIHKWHGKALLLLKKCQKL